MRAKVAKRIKYTVMGELYRLDITDQQRKDILKSKDFRNMYRNRKRKYNRTKSI